MCNHERSFLVNRKQHFTLSFNLNTIVIDALHNTTESDDNVPGVSVPTRHLPSNMADPEQEQAALKPSPADIRAAKTLRVSFLLDKDVSRISADVKRSLSPYLNIREDIAIRERDEREAEMKALVQARKDATAMFQVDGPEIEFSPIFARMRSTVQEHGRAIEEGLQHQLKLLEDIREFDREADLARNHAVVASRAEKLLDNSDEWKTTHDPRGVLTRITQTTRKIMAEHNLEDVKSKHDLEDVKQGNPSHRGSGLESPKSGTAQVQEEEFSLNYFMGMDT